MIIVRTLPLCLVMTAVLGCSGGITVTPEVSLTDRVTGVWHAVTGNAAWRAEQKDAI